MKIRYAHAKKVWEVFKIKSLGEYHDLYVQTDTPLLADVFENSRDMYIKIYKLDLPHFVSAPGLSWETCLKMTVIELELLTNKRMLYMFEEGTREGMCKASDHYKTANNKCMNNYDKNIDSSFLQYLDANNLYGWIMIKKLPIGEFKRIQKCEFLMFDEELIKNYDENSDEGFLYEIDAEYPKIIGMAHIDLPFLPEEEKAANLLSLREPQRRKKNILST